jgi:hypothetical protein
VPPDWLPPPPVCGAPLGFGSVVLDPDGPADVDGPAGWLIDGDGLADMDALAEADGLADSLVDGEGLGLPDAGQVWVRLKNRAVPVMVAVAPVSVQPAGVTIHALLVAGPPLEKLPGFAVAVMVMGPFMP